MKFAIQIEFDDVSELQIVANALAAAIGVAGSIGPGTSPIVVAGRSEKPSEAAAAKTNGVKAKTAAPPPPPAPEDDEDEEDDADEDSEDEEEEEIDDRAAASDEDEDEDEDAKKTRKRQKVLAELKQMTRLKDILLKLRSEGFDSAKSMARFCVAHKDEVPVLSKIANVDERVRRAFEVLAEA